MGTEVVRAAEPGPRARTGQVWKREASGAWGPALPFASAVARRPASALLSRQTPEVENADVTCPVPGCEWRG